MIKNRTFILPIIFFLSGAAGLIYEVTWFRLFSNLFGNSVQAASVVVSIFMGGLALGSLLFGRWIDGQSRPLKIYGFIELGIALSGWLVPQLLTWSEPLITHLYLNPSTTLFQLTLARMGIAGFVLLIPTILIGATLPVMVRSVVRSSSDLDQDLGRLYGINTLGAVVGCFLTGLYLIRWLGVLNSTLVACSLNGFVAGAVFIREWFSPTILNPQESSGPKNQKLYAGTDLTGWKFLALFSFFISGFTSLSFQVIWTRILEFTLMTGMTVHGFSVMLSVFLAGLAIGGLLYSRFLSQKFNPLKVFGVLEILIGLSVAGLLICLAETDLLHKMYVRKFMWSHLLVTSYLILIPTIFMGAAFPAVCKYITDSTEKLGGLVGLAYAFNTAGSVVGPLLTGFIFIPLLGSEITFKIMVGLCILIGCILLRTAGKNQPSRIYSRGVIPISLVLFGIFAVHRSEFVFKLLNHEGLKPYYFKEGAATSVMVVQGRSGMLLSVGGVHGSGVTHDLLVLNEIQATIPLALHPNPEEVAIVAFGTGRTSGIFAENPRVKHVDVVDISDVVFKVGHDMFAVANRGVTTNPKARLSVDDGFNFIKYTPKLYDIISADPYRPRGPASAKIYTQDFFMNAKKKLKPGGLMAFWLAPQYSREETMRISLKSFQTVFPHCSLWYSEGCHSFVVIGTEAPLKLDMAAIKSRLAARPQHNSDPYPDFIQNQKDFAGTFFMGEKSIKQWVDETNLVSTVDRPVLEYFIQTDQSQFIDDDWVLQYRESPEYL